MSDVISLLNAHTDHQDTVRTANETWDAFCVQMSERIPVSLNKFALKRGWIKQPGPWKLPDWLHRLITNTTLGKDFGFSLGGFTYASHGVENFEDLETKMKELERAWKDVVRIEVTRPADRGDNSATIYFLAIEALPKPIGERFKVTITEPAEFFAVGIEMSYATIHPGTYEVERIANPLGHKAPWLAFVGMQTTGMQERDMRADNVRFIFAV